MGQKGTRPAYEIQAPLNDSPLLPLKFQKSLAPGKYTTSKFPSSLKSGGGSYHEKCKTNMSNFLSFLIFHSRTHNKYSLHNDINKYLKFSPEPVLNLHYQSSCVELSFSQCIPVKQPTPNFFVILAAQKIFSLNIVL